jgi:hypothetical protein
MTFAARTTTTLVAVLAALVVAAGPAAASPMSVIRDCSEDGTLNGKYSPSELDGALEQLPSDLDEYTDCRAVIRRAQLGSAGAKHKAAKQSGAVARVKDAPPTAAEERQIAKASGSDDPVRIGGAGVRPGQSGAPFEAAGFGTDLPTFVFIVLIALGLSMLTGVATGVKRGISRLRR